jgi:CheY-like chemotaxis protein
MLKIVVIEEDIAMRALFCEWLDAAGHQVVGTEVRTRAVAPGIERVIVDLPNLPTQGAQAVRHVRSIYPEARIIGSSTQLSRSLPGDSAQARALAVSGLVAKPCTREELLAAVIAAGLAGRAP